MNIRKTLFIIFVSLLLVSKIDAQQKTYCNPINVDYGYTPLKDFVSNGKHRTTADPVIIKYHKKFFLFSTNQGGYWWSNDLYNWNFIPKFFAPKNNNIKDVTAPAAFVMHDNLYLIGSSQDKTFPIWKSKDPTKNDWQIAVKKFKVGAWDPGFLFDKQKNKLYLYWGSSNQFPILGTEINIKTLQSEGYVKPLISLHPKDHGWERFGEYNDNTFLKPFIEGAWMTKYKNKYYLQYGGPGTEFSGYADGVYVSNSPLSGFKYQNFNPFSYKPGGFTRGAGHGSTFQDNFGKWWHVSTIVISVKNNFERRIGIWPAGFDKDDILYSNTAYGDYPTFLPNENQNHLNGLFTGWMLLNFNKPVQVSSTLGGYQANFAVNEDIKSYWSAKTSDKGEWFQSDLGEISTVYAIQINYADQDVKFLGKSLGKFHQYKLFSSIDGKNWHLMVDKSHNKKDVPHDYLEFSKPFKARFIKIVNIKMPTGKFALSGFRVFGYGSGLKPNKVENFTILRASNNEFGERRSAWLKWKQNDNADGYVIYFGKSPNKLYGSIMVYGKNEYYFTGMDRLSPYYFKIEAFNNNGISIRSNTVVVK